MSEVLLQGHLLRQGIKVPRHALRIVLTISVLSLKSAQLSDIALFSSPS